MQLQLTSSDPRTCRFRTPSRDRGVLVSPTWAAEHDPRTTSPVLPNDAAHRYRSCSPTDSPYYTDTAAHYPPRYSRASEGMSPGNPGIIPNTGGRPRSAGQGNMWPQANQGGSHSGIDRGVYGQRPGSGGRPAPFAATAYGSTIGTAANAYGTALAGVATGQHQSLSFSPGVQQGGGGVAIGGTGRESGCDEDVAACEELLQVVARAGGCVRSEAMVERVFERLEDVRTQVRLSLQCSLSL